MSNQFVCSLSHSPFLCENKSLQLFCQDYKQNYSLLSNKKWTILCERREDIVSVRNQIFYELGNPEEIHGISIYTPDTLAAKICACLCNFSESKTDQNWNIPSSLLKPYIDMTQQEALVETILTFFGYTTSDSLAVAKQILTLIDAPLPKETHYIDLILETQNPEKQKKKQSISEISVKQILASLQLAQLELAEYARFQVLIDDYLNLYFEQELKNQIAEENPNQTSPFQVVIDILTSPFLWVCAPEYPDSFSSLTIKPGNFQSHHIRDFQNTMKNMRNLFKERKSHSLFYECRFQLNSQDQEFSNIPIFISQNNHNLLHKAEEVFSKPENSYLVLADFNPSSFASTHTKGYGQYPVTKKDLEFWQKKTYKSSPYFNEVQEQIDRLFEDFIDKISLLKKHNERLAIAQTYSLKTLSLDEKSIIDLFFIETLKGEVRIGNPSPLNQCPKTLSLFPSEHLPEKIIFLGRPHSPVSQSFHVKILNQVFHQLKQNGVEIEIPATEFMYQAYWKNLMSLPCKKEFWITKQEDIEKFPNYIHASQINPLEKIDLKIYYSELFKEEIETNSYWEKNLSQYKIGITQFEDYVLCPKKFKYKHFLNLTQSDPNQKADPRKIGTNMHKIAEQFVTRYVMLFGNEGYTQSMTTILESAINVLSNEDVFLSFQKDIWKQELKNEFQKLAFALEDILNPFYESIESIWEIENLHLEQLQQREILKRAFLRFLITELEIIKASSKKKVGLFREFPIQFDFHGISLGGRIDRVDLGKNGLQIIDYKTSNLPKNQNELTLFPSSKLKNKLSVQGALYTYGFLKQLNELPDSDEEDKFYYQVEEYSLYYLKNIDRNTNNCLTYYFPEPCSKNNSLFTEIENSYADYALRLKQGDFSCRPIQGESTCMTCEFKPICPKTYRAKSSNQHTEEEA